MKFERGALAIAGALHVAVIAALSLHAKTPKAPEPIGIPVDVSLLQVPGAPPPGSPDGNNAEGDTVASDDPATPPEAPQASNVPEEASQSSDADKSTDKPADPLQTNEKTSEPAPSNETSNSAAQSPVSTTPSNAVGTGSLALGARSRGSAAGQNTQLAEAISRAVATRIRQCWTPPRNGVPGDASSTIIVRYNIDGTLDGEPRLVRLVDQVEQPIDQPNSWELNALGALRRCSPINLAPAMYPYWQEVAIQIFGAPPLPTI